MGTVVTAGELRDIADPGAALRGSYAASTAGSSSGLTVADPGVPLIEYANGGVGIDPQTIWRTQPSVRKVVDFIARHIASVPFHTFERVSDNDRKRLTDGPIAGTLGNPRPGDGDRAALIPFRFWHAIVVDWLVFDRWAAMKTPSATRADRGVDLVRLPARRFRFVGDQLETVTGIKVVGREQPLSPASCLFDHGYSSDGKVGGTTPMQAISQTLMESTESVAWRRSLWARGGRIPAVIERPAGAPDWNKARPGEQVTAKDRFLQGWSDYMRGQGKGTPILEDGMELKAAEALTPTDAKDVEMRQLTDAEVASFFHIAPELVGARAGTYSNIAAFREMLYGPTLGPYIVPIEQVVNAMLVPDFDPSGLVYVEAAVEAKMRGSFAEQAKYLQTAIGAPFLTRAEGRGRLNLSYIDGTDELVTPLNVTLGGQPSPAAPPSERDDERD